MGASTCSARILQPFMRYVDSRRLDRDLVPRDFWEAPADSRVSLESTHAMLDCAVDRLSDRLLGIKLGRSMCFGEGGPFDYAIRSAPTIRAAVDVAGRYAPLVSDSLAIWFEVWRRHAMVRLNDASWTRQAADFAMAAFYKLHLSDQLPAAARLECWFPYETPQDVGEHQRCFGDAALRFNAPCFAFTFDRGQEDAPMKGADPVLHAAHCARIDSLLADLSAASTFKARVRRLIEREIQETRGATAPRVAHLLHMSRRTMSRQLHRDGTSFADEVDAARRQLAFVYLDERQTPLKEVAFRLGFSHAESFHRAFKRWTGETPVTRRKRAALPTVD
jgi:AraC-like DNA-binding protein